MKNLKRQGWGRNDQNGMFCLNAAEKTEALSEGTIIVCIFAYFFYASFWAVPFMLPILISWTRRRKRTMGENKKEQFRMQFRDAVMSVSTNQRAGYSIENSFREAYKDMKLLYGSKSVICTELGRISVGLNNHVPLGELLTMLGDKSDIDDIRQFAEIFRIAHKSGGSMPQIIGYTAEMIDGRAEVEKDIHLMLASRKYEQKLMEGIPFFLIAYMKVTNKGFFDVLYHNISGVMIMTLCMLVYIAACVLSEKIVQIVI